MNTEQQLVRAAIDEFIDAMPDKVPVNFDLAWNAVHKTLQMAIKDSGGRWWAVVMPDAAKDECDKTQPTNES